MKGKGKIMKATAKKLIAIFLITVMTVSLTLPAKALTDIQAAHNYTISDALSILKYLAGMTQLTIRQQELYNLTPGADVKINDVLEILKHLAGMSNAISGIKTPIIVEPPPTNISAQIAEVVRLVNIERAKEKLPALKSNNSDLNKLAQIRANEIVKAYRPDHRRPDNRQWHTVFDDNKVTYRAIGENIAKGYRTPAEVVQAWMDSPGHRANIMKKEFTHIGIGISTGTANTIYWSQLFWRGL